MGAPKAADTPAAAPQATKSRFSVSFLYFLKTGSTLCRHNTLRVENTHALSCVLHTTNSCIKYKMSIVCSMHSVHKKAQTSSKSSS